MTVRVLVGDALSVLRTLESESVQCVVTSPPYFGLRAYGTDPIEWPDGWHGELGSEPTPALFLEHLWSIFDEVKRVLRPDGLCFVNIGDSYSGSGRGPTGHNGLQNAETRQGFTSGYLRENGEWSKGGRKSKTEGVGGIPAKSLLLVPQRFAIGMQERGWWVRSEIVWAKTSAMPESVRDRPTSAWEPIWMFAKSQRYFYDGEAVRQPHSPNTHAYAKGGSFDRPGEQWPTRGLDGAQSMRGVDRATYRNPAGASLRNVWLLGHEPLRDSHYAAFVTEIPRRCILAGTSEKGACPACGAGWVRVVEREADNTGYRNGPGGKKHRENQDRNESRSPGTLSEVARWRTETLGWEPSCTCPPTDPVPCVVLDMFGGSGTTGLVAGRLGRDAILVELNPEYAEMARKRIEADAGTLFGEPVTVEAPRQASLFDEAAG